MVEPVKCPECGKIVRDRRALGGHLRMKHGISSTATSEGKHIEVAQNSTELKYKGGKSMAEFCPECAKKDDERRWLEHNHLEELEKVKAEAAKPTELRDDATILEDSLKHYLTCPDGNCNTKDIVNRLLAPKFDQKAIEGGKNLIENLTKPENKPKLLEVMKAAGVEEMPSKIIIKGLSIKGGK